MKKYCPCCKNIKLKVIGKIPTNCFVSGKELDKKFCKERFLHFCNKCNFYFVVSNYEIDILNEFYKNLDINYWDDNLDKRYDWVWAKDYIINYVKKDASILDLGCWDGKFLNYLDNCYYKYGIELNKVASAIAKKRNVNIICDNFDDIDKVKIKFDVITAFDVIEHIYSPSLFLTKIKKILKDDGIVIISTCNSDNFLWKYVYKNKYYYCTIFEHISFINEKWLKKICEEKNFQVIFNKKFSHHVDRRIKTVFRNILQNLVFLMNPKLYNFLKKNSNKVVPDLFNYRDHMFIILKNKGRNNYDVDKKEDK